MPQAAPDFHFIPQIYPAKGLVSYARELMFPFMPVISGMQWKKPRGDAAQRARF
jgi:hypothetical protein